MMMMTMMLTRPLRCRRRQPPPAAAPPPLSSLPPFSQVFYRERAAHFYHPEAYAISLIIREWPFAIFYALLFSSLAYFAGGMLPAAGPFFTYVCALALLLFYYSALATWLSSLMPNGEVAGILSGIIVSLTNLFAGLQIPPVNLAPGWLFMYYIDGPTWALRLNSMTQFDPSYAQNSAVMYATDPVTGVLGRTTPYQYVANLLQYSFDERWQAMGILVAIFTVFNLFAILYYRIVNHNSR